MNRASAAVFKVDLEAKKLGAGWMCREYCSELVDRAYDILGRVENATKPGPSRTSWKSMLLCSARSKAVSRIRPCSNRRRRIRPKGRMGVYRRSVLESRLQPVLAGNRAYSPANSLDSGLSGPSVLLTNQNMRTILKIQHRELRAVSGTRCVSCAGTFTSV